jgi:hypothetical protein
MNIGKLLKGVVCAAKKSPEIALAVAGMVAPGVVKKIAPIVVAVAVKL